MDTSTRQIDIFISAKPCWFRNHHRSCYPDTKIHKTNPFARGRVPDKSEIPQNEPILVCSYLDCARYDSQGRVRLAKGPP